MTRPLLCSVLFLGSLAAGIAFAQPPGRGGPPREKAVPTSKPAVEATAGVQWFTTLEAAKKEAERTGRPILLVSAAPHCGGVSGIW